MYLFELKIGLAAGLANLTSTRNLISFEQSSPLKAAFLTTSTQEISRRPAPLHSLHFVMKSIFFLSF
jgi:predicted transporter